MLTRSSRPGQPPGGRWPESRLLDLRKVCAVAPSPFADDAFQFVDHLLGLAAALAGLAAAVVGLLAVWARKRRKGG